MVIGEQSQCCRGGVYREGFCNVAVGGEQFTDEAIVCAQDLTGDALLVAGDVSGLSVRMADEQSRAESTIREADFTQQLFRFVRLHKPQQRQAWMIQQDGFTSLPGHPAIIAGESFEVDIVIRLAIRVSAQQVLD